MLCFPILLFVLSEGELASVNQTVKFSFAGESLTIWAEFLLARSEKARIRIAICANVISADVQQRCLVQEGDLGNHKLFDHR